MAWPRTEQAARRLLRLSAAAEDLLLVLLVAAMAMLAIADILLRNLGNGGFAWSEPLMRMGVLWLALVGAMVASRRGEHITVDILPHLLTGRGARMLRRLTDLFTAVVCAVLAWHGARFVLMDWRDGMEALPGLPAWAVEAIIPVGFAIIALRYGAAAVAGRTDESTR